MKKSMQSLFAVAAIALSALAAQAQTAPKILVVDLAKIFDTHYKTQEQQAKLQADEAKARDQLSADHKGGQRPRRAVQGARRPDQEPHRHGRGQGQGPG